MRAAAARSAGIAALLLSLLSCKGACGDGREPAEAGAEAPPAKSAKSAAVPDERGGPYWNLPVPSDFEEEARAHIDASSYREALERLERDFAEE